MRGTEESVCAKPSVLFTLPHEESRLEARRISTLQGDEGSVVDVRDPLSCHYRVGTLAALVEQATFERLLPGASCAPLVTAIHT